MLVATLLTPQNLALGAVAVGVAYVIYWRFFHCLSDVPGPFLASFSNLWMVYRVIRGDILEHLAVLHRKHGALVRVAPNEISAVDGEAFRKIYSHASGFYKTDFYDAFGNPYAPVHEKDLFTQRSEQRHAAKRRLLSSIYSMSSVLSIEENLDESLNDFMKVLDQSASEDTVLDLGKNCHRYTFDSIGILFFGQIFGFLKAQEDIDGLLAAVTFRTRHRAFFGVIPWLNRYAGILEKLIPALRLATQQTRSILKRAEVCVKGRLDEPSTCEDMLTKIVSLHQAQPKNFTQSEAVTEAFAAISAGNDSTAIALRAIFYHLLRNPRCMEILVKEIDAHDQAGELSELVFYKEAMKLPYLNAVIKEGMRRFPSVGLTLPRYVPKGGIEIAGKFLPEKTAVGMSAHVLHFDREIFGTDADYFVPERWLQEDAVKLERYFFEFGSGSRTCIGKNIALAEIYRLIPNVLRRFSIQLADPTKDWKVVCGAFASQDGVLVKVARRPVDSEARRIAEETLSRRRDD